MTNKNSILNFIFALPFLWCVTGVLIYQDAPKDMVYIVIITSILFLIFHNIKSIAHNFTESIICKLILSSLFLMTFTDYVNGYSSTTIRAFSVSLFMYLFTPQQVMNKLREHLHLIVLLGSVVSFTFVIYEINILNNVRMWSINPVRYTTLSCIFAILSLVGLISSKDTKIKIIYFISLILSLNILVLGQTRGTILAFMSALLLYLFVLICKNGTNIINKKSIAFVILLITPLIIFNKETINKRYTQTISEINKINSGNLETSIGLRLQMWKSGLDTISKVPVLGFGDRHFDIKKDQYNNGFISKSAARFHHYHNQFIDSFVKLGVFGFIFNLAAFILPWYIYTLNKSDLNLAIAISSFSVFIASLTDVPLYHPQSIIVYFMFISLMEKEPH